VSRLRIGLPRRSGSIHLTESLYSRSRLALANPQPSNTVPGFVPQTLKRSWRIHYLPVTSDVCSTHLHRAQGQLHRLVVRSTSRVATAGGSAVRDNAALSSLLPPSQLIGGQSACLPVCLCVCVSVRDIHQGRQRRHFCLLCQVHHCDQNYEQIFSTLVTQRVTKMKRGEEMLGLNTGWT
jgi:hypothetical protein